MSAGGLAPEDIIAAAGFVGVVVVALGYQAIRSAVADSPRARMRQRLLDSVSEVAPAVAAGVAEDAAAAVQRRKRLGEDSWAARTLNAAKEQAEHMGGVTAVRWIAGGALAMAVLVAVSLIWLGQTVWTAGIGAMAGAVVGTVLAFRLVVARYRARFLQGFPDALDLMIRAVRAGVPVVQAIIAAGRELPDPVGREFRMMGDSLRLGMDAQEVMNQASKRIGVPDFRFFVVCLQLQRETGGPLADTLENLSAIIRSRREVRLKTRALTAQGKSASKVIALVPFVVMGALNFLGGDNMDVLFHTERGQRILGLAMGMVFVGLAVINRMSKLED